MNREEFEAQVESRAGPALQGSDQLKGAIYDRVKSGGPFYHSDLRAVLRDAGERREQADTRQKEDAPRRSPRPKPGAEAHFISRILVEDLKPWTEGLRKEGFDAAAPPCPNDIGAAAEYIEEASASDLTRWNESREDRGGDHKRIHQLARRLGLDVAAKKRVLPYARPGDNHRKNVPVVPGTFLFKLAGEIDRVSRKTGLPPDALTAHVFTGATPLMSRVRITDHESHVRLPTGKQAHLRSVTLTFRTADLTFKELRTIYDEVRSYMGGKGVQAPTLEDLEFWELVQEMGTPPQPYQGVRKFWLEVLSRWNREHPEDPPLQSWEGLQDKYERLTKRLGVE